MGLDMFVEKVKDPLPAPTGFVTTDRKFFEQYPDDYIGQDWWEGKPQVLRDEDELFYWRKHPDLHGWFGKLYAEKVGVDDDSNGNPGWGKASGGNFSGPVEITAEDLDRLEAVVEAGGLPHTEGFYFGKSDPDYKEGDLEFIAKAREALAEGWYLFYHGSW